MEFVTLAQAQAMPQFSGVGSVDLRRALGAANGWVSARVRDFSVVPPEPYGFTSAVPGELEQAVVLLTARYLARVNSVEGLVSMGDQAAYLPSQDRDVASLIEPYRPVVFG